jgi:hypothetical protein
VAKLEREAPTGTGAHARGLLWTEAKVFPLEVLDRL